MWKNILVSSIHNVWEFLAIVAPLVLSLCLTWSCPEKKFIITIIILTGIVIFLIKYIIEIFDIIGGTKRIYPKLRTYVDNRLIFEASDLFEGDSIVAIYKKTEIEQLLGYGWVERIHPDTNLIQVIVIETSIDMKIFKRNEIKNKIILKPSIPRRGIDTAISRNLENEGRNYVNE